MIRLSSLRPSSELHYPGQCTYQYPREFVGPSVDISLYAPMSHVTHSWWGGDDMQTLKVVRLSLGRLRKNDPLQTFFFSLV
jgi:hypothetical protein